MRRLLCVLAMVLAVAACGDDADGPAADDAAEDATEESAGSGPEVVENDAAAGDTEADDAATTSVPTDAPAGDAPDETAANDEGRGDPLVLVADLTAAAAVPPPGDDGGSGRIEIRSSGSSTLCVDMVVTGLDSEVTAAHVHRGEPGASGGVAFGIGLPTTDGDTATWRDVCVDVEASLVEQLEADPGAHYANIHSETHPDSALRGQLEAATIFDLTLS